MPKPAPISRKHLQKALAAHEFEGPTLESSRFFRDTLELRWIRLPKPGTRCPWSGLSRTGINILILPSAANRFRPPVASTSLRQPGQQRATRLVKLGSLLRYIDDQAAKTMAEGLTSDPKKQTSKGKRK
jgi:hypothetical protein